MAEYVRMPKAHYEAACNSIRAKTGKGDLIKSGDMSAEIESITGGGSADVRYVTFKSYDGAIEYGKIPVAVGYDCPNPKFDTPTRESTAQYSYTFYGWATTPNGGADANWNKSITEDKTVYANFSAAVRYYTITYYDGDTVLKTESLAYGADPAYVPKKEGFVLAGWQPELAAVTSDASYYAQWRELSGFSYMLTMLEGDLPTSANGLNYGKVAINNAGTLIAFAFSGRQNDGNNYTPIYNISDGTPVKLTGTAMTANITSDISFNYDDSYLYMEGYKSSDLKHHISRCNATRLSNFSASTVNSDSPSKPIRCSPVADLCGWFRHVSGGNYNFFQRGGATIAAGFNANDVAYSPDGVHVALCKGSGTGVKVYSIDGALVADTAKFANTNPVKVSYNADGSLLAVSYGQAPWVEVYETTSYTKVCDLSDIVSASSFAELMGDDIIVVGSGTSVQVRTITKAGHKAYEHDVPAYEELGNVVNIVKNHSGTRAVIQTDKKVTVWALT